MGRVLTGLELAGITTTTSKTSGFSPTPWRVALALATSLICFCLPQRVPLEWFPLNEPGDDILYLEIKCSADGEGLIKIYKNITRGINELDTIYWPITASEKSYTYIFPLPDAPIIELRLDPPGSGVSLDIDSFRIVDRRGSEVRRFTIDMLRPVAGIASITPSQTGFTVTSSFNAENCQVSLELFSPIVAKGIDQRNYLRCIYSTSYLGFMLWILLLAVVFAFWQPVGWRDFLIQTGFMACLALMFAVVGNRGLIKNSWHYAQFNYPELPDEVRLELDLISAPPTGAQLFWDSGEGFGESESDMINLAPHQGLQTARFRLPRTEIKALRYDPRHNGGDIEIRGIRVVDWGNRTHALLPLDSLLPGQQVDALEFEDGRLKITTTPGTDDPTTAFTPEAVAHINAAVSARLTRFNY